MLAGGYKGNESKTNAEYRVPLVPKSATNRKWARVPKSEDSRAA